MKRFNKRAFRRSLFASLSRLIGIGLAAGGGTLLKQLIGDGFTGWGIAIGMMIVSFLLMAVAEYEREIDD